MLFAATASFFLHIVAILHPTLVYDDWGILASSWTWRRTVDHLWMPNNEHMMPLGRITTWALVHAVDGQARVPLLTALHGPVLVLICMWMLYVFLRRELDRPFCALVGM